MTSVAGLEAELDQFDRILGGFCGDLIANRFSEEERKLLDERQNLEEGAQQAMLETYVSRAIDQLMESAMALWRPLAQDAIRIWAEKGLLEKHRTVPIAVRLTAGDDVASLDLFAALNSIATGDGLGAVPFGATLYSAFDVFLVSAAVALLSNEWRQADHFAEIAVNAAEHLSRRGDVSKDAAVEAYYLGAVAKRFRLGLLTPDESLEYFRAAEKTYDAASSLLDRAENEASNNRTYLSYRANAERASLNLFYASFCLSQADELKGATQAVAEVMAAGEQAFVEARVALGCCLAVQASLPLRDVPPTLDGSGEALLRAQFLLNIAAWFALSPFFPAVSLDRVAERLAEQCEASADELMRNLSQAGRHDFLADILAFRIFRGVEADHARAKLADLDLRPSSAELAIDDHWSARIKSYWTNLPRQ